MRFFVVLLSAVVVAQAASADLNGDLTDSFTLSVLNDWVLPWAATGLDVYISPSETLIVGVDGPDNFLRFYNTNGAFQYSIPLASSNTNSCGVALNNDPYSTVYYTNDGDFAVDDLYYTENSGATWSTVWDPAGFGGRGMDFDGVNYWEVNRGGAGGESGVWRFVPGGSQGVFTTPEVGLNPFGITVFPYGNYSCVAVTSDLNKIFFYQWDGSALTYLESVDCPVSGTLSSYGLAYSEASGHMYWSYNSSGEYHLVELSIEFTALDRISWGTVKSSF